MGVFTAILIAVLLMGALVWLALRQPLCLEVHWGTNERLILLSWLGFVSERDTLHRTSTLRWRDRQLRSRAVEEEKPRKQKEESHERQRRRRKRWWLQPDLMRDVIGALWAGVRLFFERLRIERGTAKIRIATPDPSLTGILYGSAVVLQQMVPYKFRNVALELNPDFESERPQFQGEICLSIRPTDILRVGGRVFCKLPKRKLWQALRASRRERTPKGGGSRGGTQRTAPDVGE